jgi:Zn-dependent peptidase ImmA (M78 family)
MILNNGSDTPLTIPGGDKKLWQGRTARALQRVYDGAYPPSLFIAKARTLHHEFRLSGPPFDPWEIADLLNISIQEQSMALDGYLERRPDDTFAIFVRREAQLPRKRFTICHEIAHTFFFDILADGVKFRQQHQEDSEEERLCDIAAAEILMPFACFNGDLKAAQSKGGLAPTHVLRLMERYKVSLQAVATRINWISPETTCALWEKKGCAVNLVWAAPARSRSLVLCQTGRTSVEDAAAAPGKDFAARDSFYVLGKKTRLIRRFTSSRRLRSGQILSVLTPSRASDSRGIRKEGDARPVQLGFRFT